MPISATNLNKAYLAYFGRPADAVGQAYFATLEQADVIKAFDASAESKAIYGGDTAAKINAIYKNLFNREAEPAGLTYWLSLVSSGRVTPAGAAFSILEGAQGTDKTAIDNKLAASEAFIKAMDTTTEIVNYSGLNAAASARFFLATVDASAASLTAAVAGAQAAVTAAISTTQGNDYGVSLQLTRNRDSTDATAQGANVIASTSGNDSYTGTVDPANSFNNTINNDDYIDGAQGNDTLTLALLGSNTSNARVKNIENLVLGTNVAAVVTYDLNINAGGQQTTGYQTIAADRIITGEELTIQNVFKGSTDTALPKFIWDNASNTTNAGVVNFNYLSGQTTGTADTQAVDLRSVTGGQLNLDAGIETVTLTSGTGISPVLNGTNTERVTLVNQKAVAADLASGTTLKTVNLAGAAEIGKAADVVAASGQTDRAVGTDAGVTATATASNLLSVGATVTKIDAGSATAAVNVRFTNTAASNNTFIGGTGNDYSEYELGNINASGGKGNDTFAFITNAAGNLGNSSFGESDTIDGGEGADTIQIGLNGAQTYNISQTELRNKSSIGTIDLRGQENNLTLSSDFVSKADTADSITVRTDKIVQTSATDSGNLTTHTFALEDASRNTIDLTNLDINQTVNFIGGSGSDRIILSDATFNVQKTIDGGNYTNGVGGSAYGVGSHDTITLVTNGERVVIDNNDLANVKDVEGFVLTKNSAQAVYSITLTAAFLNANTEAIDNGTNTVAMNDRFFFLGTAAAANGRALTAGDIVNIDVTNIMTVAVGTRQVDLGSLIASNATINLINNGTSTLYAQNNVVVNAAVAPAAFGTDAAGRAEVIGSPAVPAAVVVNTLTAQGAGFNTTSGFLLTGNQAGINMATAAQDVLNSTADNLVGSTVNLAAGVTDTLNITTQVTALNNVGVNNAIQAAGATGSIEFLNLQAGSTANVTSGATAGLTVTLGAASNFTLGAAGTVVGSTGADLITGSAAADSLSNGGGAGADTINGGGGADVFTITGTGAATVNGGGGIDTLTATGTGGVRFTGGNGQDVVTFNSTNAAADRIVFANGAAGVVVATNADADTITGFNVSNDIVVLDEFQTTALTAAAATPVVQAVSAAGALVLSNTSDVTVLNFDMGGVTSVLAGVTNGAALLANLGGALTAAQAGNTGDGYIMAYDNGNAYLYAYTDATTAGVLAAEIQLIGTFNGVAVGGLSVANFALEV